jgi:RNA polymerase sigma-70 factor (ECF subfamily)
MLGLSAQHREIIVATYFGGRTIREAAWVLGIAPAVAKARLYQAMRDLSGMAAAGRTAAGSGIGRGTS